MTDRFESELREGFRALRESERAAAPSFDEVIGDAGGASPGRPGGPGGHLVRSAVPAALAAAVIATLALLPTEEERFEAALTEGVSALHSGWAAPSDFLLSYPGSEFYSHIPSLGATPIGAPTEDTEPARTSEEDNR